MEFIHARTSLQQWADERDPQKITGLIEQLDPISRKHRKTLPSGGKGRAPGSVTVKLLTSKTHR
jgi:hypothetical protein